MTTQSIALALAVWAVPVLIAITFHEAAHGWVAWKLGDDTAKRMGRVSFNPLRHVDPIGTVLVPAILLIVHAPFLFGWAKPVPVNFWRLRHPRRDMVWVAAAGPGMNVALAVISAYLLHLALVAPTVMVEWGIRFLTASIAINLVLAVFNMMPLPPLDGGRVAVGLLPRALAMRLAAMERFGLIAIIVILFVLPMLGSEMGVNLNVLYWIVTGPVDVLRRFILGLAGFGF